MKIQRQSIRLYYNEGLYHFVGRVQFEITGHEITDVTAECEITQGDEEDYPEFTFCNIICKDEDCNEIPCLNMEDLILNLENSIDINYR